jgi:hypothetical protein
MKRLFLALAMVILLLLIAGVGTATAGPPGQSSGQAAGSDQGAGALAGTAQQGPTNSNSPIRVLSPGDAGSVAQSNEASSNATAGNQNGTAQTAGQTQGGGSGVQAVGQSATNAQDALALALTLQKGASNENAPVSVGSEGDGGDVSQSNTASSDATAGNANGTQQTADQTQAGTCCGSAGSQVVGQSAENEQDATALSATVQEKPSNSNLPVRVLSPGDDGSVSQTNEATSNATAANQNGTTQTADQSQLGAPSTCGCGRDSLKHPSACGCPVAGPQVVGQSAENAQEAKAVALTEQSGASNENISVRVLSPGDSGSVSQSNVASSNATAGNSNTTGQSATQSQAGSGGSQTVGQSAGNEQSATALSGTVQKHPSNSNISVRVLSPGDDGDVEQSNVATSNATAGNVNGTQQSANQTQGGGSDSCKCGSAGSQVIGQSADSKQGALAGALTVQKGAENENISVRVLSPGKNGSVSQSNVASSNATAGNSNRTGQTADQSQAGGSCGCGSGTQVIGQSASNLQGAAAFSATIQEKPSNSNTPIRVLSEGDDGDVTQSNVATSNATAANENGTSQTADQSQGSGSGIQVIGQESKSGQLALSAALTAQLGASNENAPVRVLSPGYGGSVSQTNHASSNSAAGNSNATGQNAVQHGGKDSGCCGGKGIQAIGQSSQNWQAAGALAVTLQLGKEPPCKCHSDSQIGNRNAPTRVSSPGDDGSVRQSNVATSDAKAANLNATRQAADQLWVPSCRCKPGTGVQAIGQLAQSGQTAGAIAATLQLGGKNAWDPDRKKSPGDWGDLAQSEQNAAHDGSGNNTSTDQSRNQVGSGLRRW